MPKFWIDETEEKDIQVEFFSSSSLTLPTRRLMVVAMILSDIISIITAVYFSSLIRQITLGPLLFPDSFLWVPAFLVFFIFAAAYSGLYPGTGLSSVQQLRILTFTSSFLILFVISGTFFIRHSEAYSRLLMGLTWLIGLFLIPCSRIIFRHFLAKAEMWGEPVVIIGNADQVETLQTYYRKYPKIGIKPEAGFILPSLFRDLSVLQRESLMANARKVSRELNIHSVIVAYEYIDDIASIREVIYEVFDHVLILNPENSGFELSGVTIRQYGKIQSFEIHHTLMNQIAQFEKRVIDLFISTTGLVLLSPLLFLIAILVAINSHGDVFYRQKRLGKRNKEFQIIKFRTMVPNADRVLQNYLNRNPERRLEWDHYQKLKNDPRITFVGRFLRRFSLDELPQLWNVLVGDMSFVGPRPIMVNQRDLYGSNFQHFVRVRPGITGLWQISGRNHTSFATRVNLDVEYVMTWSIWLDIYIIIRTFWVVISQDGVS